MKFLKYLDIRQFSKTNRYYFLFNVVLGLGVLIFFVITRNIAIQQDFINMLFDPAIELRTGVGEFGRECDAKISSSNIVVLSFDDEAMKSLGRPHMTPRNKIADLVRFAYEGGASLIILDMILSDTDYTPAHIMAGDSMPVTGQERDKELFNLLEKIKNDDTSNTKVIFATDIYSDFTVRRSEFSALTDNKKIYAAASEVSEGRGSDRKVRFWLPYLEINAGEDDAPERKILWSFPILALALTEGGAEDLSRIEDEILKGDDEKFTLHCKSGRDFVFYREKTDFNGIAVRDTQSLQYNRIQYVFTPKKSNWDKKTINLNKLGYWRDNGLSNEEIDFTDKIVVIGREDRECNDFLATIIGTMPGLYVNCNAIATILGKTQPHISPLWKCILIEVILIVVIAYIFVHLNYSGVKRFVIAMAILGGMIGLCAICSYIYFWATNEFVYLRFSFASIAVYNFVSQMEKFFQRGNDFMSGIKNVLRKKTSKEIVKSNK